MNKRIIISESERQSILNLHTLFKNKLNEQGLNFDNTADWRTSLRTPPPKVKKWTPPTTTTTTTIYVPLSKGISDMANQLHKDIANFNPKDNSVPPVTDRKIDCASTKNPGRCKPKVLEVQVKINDKCTKITQKLVEDGIYGNKTFNAIKTCTGMDVSSSGRAVASAEEKTTTTTSTTKQVIVQGGIYTSVDT